jgi:hypothetical protein
MTRIEKAVKIVSDLYDFNRKIPRVSPDGAMRDGRQNRAPRQTVREDKLPVAWSPSRPLR